MGIANQDSAKADATKFAALIKSYPNMSTASPDKLLESIAEDLADYLIAGGATIQRAHEADDVEGRVVEAKRLVESTPFGFITDCDTILCDIMEEADFEISGIGIDIFNIWLNSKDRKSVEKIFYDLTDVPFEDFVNLCIQKTTKREN